MTKPNPAEYVVRLVADESKAAAERFSREMESEAQESGEYIDTAFTEGTIEIYGPGPESVDGFLNSGRNREGKSEAYFRLGDPEFEACPPPPIKRS
jgi:hypothetical protein